MRFPPSFCSRTSSPAIRRFSRASVIGPPRKFIPSSSNPWGSPHGAPVRSGFFLYADNSHSGQIDVSDNTFAHVSLPGSFTDPTLPSGYAPFNVQMLNGKLYVTYALQDASGQDDVAGPGNGYVSAFDLSG